MIPVRRGVEIQTTDDVAAARVQHREGEAPAGGEVVGVAVHVPQVPVQGHPVQRWPAAVRIARCRADVLDAGRPGCQVGLVVLGPQRLQPELLGHQGGGRDERPGDEALTF